LFFYKEKNFLYYLKKKKKKTDHDESSHIETESSEPSSESDVRRDCSDCSDFPVDSPSESLDFEVASVSDSCFLDKILLFTSGFLIGLGTISLSSPLLFESLL